MRLTIHLLLLIIVSQFSSLSFDEKKFDEGEGYEVEFDYKNHPHEREIAYQWYLDEFSKYLPGITKNDIGIDFYDVDNDGVKEMLVLVKEYPIDGGPFTILRITENADKKYQLIKGFEIASSTPDVKILKSCTLGWHDILSDKYARVQKLWKWNGKEYFYEKKFDEGEGYDVEFDYKNYPHEREIAYQWYLNEAKLYHTDIAKNRNDIGIDFYDVDNDGVKEMLVFVNGGEDCPIPDGGPFTILRITENADKKYQFIKGFEPFVSATTDIKLLKSCTLGWHDILFGRHKTFSSLWQWDGKSYYNSEVMRSILTDW